MKNINIQILALSKVIARLGFVVVFAALFFLSCDKTNSPTSDNMFQPLGKTALSNRPFLSSAESFAVLGNTAVTLTTSTINGDVGSFGPITNTGSTINGTIHEGDGVYLAAYDDFLAAYDELAATTCEQTLTLPLSGQTLSPGVYCTPAAVAETNSVLTLKGPADGVWIFKIGTGGTGALTGTNFSVVMEGGGVSCNVYWWVAEAATMTTSDFQGTILAGAAITVTGVAGGTFNFNGNAYAKAAVTLTDAIVTNCGNVSPPDKPKPDKPKANEGVGNGVDGNTPGHDHNGGNDDPAFTPGNPGAKNK